MKHFIREIIGFSLCVIAGFFQKKPRILSLYFHDPSPESFEDIVKWCKSHGYGFVTLEEFGSMLNKGKPADERIAFVSFDDGWRSNLELLPIIEKYNVPITVFISTEPIVSGNYWWEYGLRLYSHEEVEKIKRLPYEQFKRKISEMRQCCELKRSSINENDFKILTEHPLVSIQSHTVTHPILTNCDENTLRYELSESKRYLENKTDKKIIAFSYPNGNVSEREKLAVIEAGYRLAFTTEPDSFDFSDVDRFLIPRRAMNTYGGKYENIAKALGIWQKFIR